jgi:hypothetical protein
VATLALVCLYAAVTNGHLNSIDGHLMYRQAQAILYLHSLHFPLTPRLTGNNTTAPYGIGLSLLYLPGLWLWSWGQPDVHALIDAQWSFAIVGVPVQILVTAASAYLVARFLRALGFDRATALYGLLLYGLASPAIVYARGDWAQPLTGLCWISALYAAVRFRRTGRHSLLILCGATLCYAVLTRPVEGTLLMPCVLLVLLPDVLWWRWPRRAWTSFAIVGVAYLCAVVLTLLVDWAKYGSPFVTGYGGEGWGTPLWIGLPGALVSPARGILWSFPAAFLVPLGLRRLWQSGQRRAGLALALLIGLQLLNVSTWDVWWGGWNWGLRLFVPALPLVAILAACGVASLSPAIRPWWLAAVFVAGIVWAVPCVIANFGFGYAAMANGSLQSFAWRAYPPVGAWASLGPGHPADILWLYLAPFTANGSLIPLALLTGAALLLVGRAVYLVSASRPQGHHRLA